MFYENEKDVCVSVVYNENTFTNNGNIYTSMASSLYAEGTRVFSMSLQKLHTRICICKFCVIITFIRSDTVVALIIFHRGLALLTIS